MGCATGPQGVTTQSSRLASRSLCCRRRHRRAEWHGCKLVCSLVLRSFSDLVSARHIVCDFEGIHPSYVFWPPSSTWRAVTKRVIVSSCSPALGGHFSRVGYNCLQKLMMLSSTWWAPFSRVGYNCLQKLMNDAPQHLAGTFPELMATFRTR